MFKNVASQKIKIFAFTPADGLPKTGDAANLTAYVSKDNGAVTVLGDTSATEMDATNAPGWYLFDLTQGETNADSLLFTGKSSTAGVKLVGMDFETFPANFTTQSIDSNGRVDVIKIAGTTQTAGDIYPKVSALTFTVANQVDVNVLDWKSATAPAMTGDAFARLGAPAGASVSADVAAVKVDTAAVKVQTDKLTFTVANQVDSNVLDWKSATAPAMTGDAFARLGAPAGASVSADVAAVKVDTAAVKVQTDKFTFTIANQVDSNVLDWKSATAPAMTGDAFARLGAPAGASVSADIAAIQAIFPSNFNALAISAGGRVKIQSGITKNVALAKFEFLMTDSTNHAPVTGKAVTVTRSIDNGAFGAGTLSAVTEIGSGIYSVDFGAGDLNGNVITLMATAAGSDTTFVTLVTDT